MDDPDDLAHALGLELAKSYLGEAFAVHGDWTPQRERRWPFSVEPDKDDPWQFRNMRVTWAGSASSAASSAVPCTLCAGQLDERNRQGCPTRKHLASPKQGHDLYAK